MPQRLLPILCALLALLLTTSAYAAIVEESFDYAPEDLGAINSNTLNGGIGFSDDGTNRFWTPVLDPANTNGLPSLVSPGLSLSGVPSSGYAVSRTNKNKWSTLSREISTTSQTSLQANSSMWFSTIVNFKNNRDARVGFAFGTDALDPDSNPNMGGSSGSGFGFRFGTSIEGRTDYEKIYAMGFNGGSTSLSTDFYDTGYVEGDGAQDLNYLVVGEIDSSAATDVLNLYVFAEGDAITVSGSPDATLALAVDVTTFDTISWNDNQNYGVDEIRLGTDFASVVPEPSSYALLLGLATLGAAAIRRPR